MKFINTIIVWVFIIFSDICLAQLNETKLIPSDGQLNDEFGYSVAGDGNYLVVGSPNSPYPYDHYGAVYVYEKNGGLWEEKSRLVASDSSAVAWFGYSVSIDGDNLLIGAFRDPENGPQSGAAYIFHLDSTGEWTEQQKLLPADGSAYDEFGTSVSLYENWALIGAPFDHNNSVETGSAYIFKLEDNVWVEDSKLEASNGVGTSPQFGNSVSISGDYAIIGAYADEGLGNNPGAAYIFHFNGTSWGEQTKLNAYDVELNHYFGCSVSISGDYIAVGSSSANTPAGGAAIIFHRAGNEWNEEAVIEGSSAFTTSDFGFSVSIDGDYLVAGAPDDETNGNHAGCAYIFKREGINWIEQSMLLAGDGNEDDWMGRSVYIRGDQVLVGAPVQDAGGLYCGAVYVYTGFITDINETSDPFSADFRLEQNYPNPFNPVTKIKYTTPAGKSYKEFVQLKVYDIIGNEVATLVNEEKSPGTYVVEFPSAVENKELSSGVYFYRLRTSSFIQTKKMIFLK